MAIYKWTSITDELQEAHPDLMKTIKRQTGIEDLKTIKISCSNAGNLKIFDAGVMSVIGKEFLTEDIAFLRVLDADGLDPVEYEKIQRLAEMKRLIANNKETMADNISRELTSSFGFAIKVVGKKSQAFSARVNEETLIVSSEPVFRELLDDKITVTNIEEAVERQFLLLIDKQIDEINESKKQKEIETCKVHVASDVIRQIFEEGDVQAHIIKFDPASGRLSIEVPDGKCYAILDYKSWFSDEFDIVEKENDTQHTKDYIVTYTEDPDAIKWRVKEILHKTKFTYEVFRSTRIKELAEYEKIANPIYNGLKKAGSLTVTYVPDEGKTMTCNAFVIKIDNHGKRTVAYKKEDRVKDASLKTAQTCIKFLKELQEKYEFHFGEKVSGNGLLYGSTNAHIFLNGKEYITALNAGCFKGSVTEWKKSIKKQILDFLKFQTEEEKRERERTITVFNPYIQDYLTHDILDFLRMNDDYITTNAVVQAMRGTAIQLNTRIDPTLGCGCYNIFSKSEIEKIVNSLLAKGFIYEVKLKGTYGAFYILKCPDKTAKMLSTPYNTDLKSALKKYKSGTALTDYEADLLFLEIYKKSQIKPRDYIQCIDLLEHNPAMACRNVKKYQELFHNASKEIKALITMKKKECDERTHKLLIQIVKKPENSKEEE